MLGMTEFIELFLSRCLSGFVVMLGMTGFMSVSTNIYYPAWMLRFFPSRQSRQKSTKIDKPCRDVDIVVARVYVSSRQSRQNIYKKQHPQVSMLITKMM